ncbi:MAG: hypothetical protein M0R73_04275 [Dehalococcoidia bacterium]|nr:hypothetical protein [Dehalococcoidia bacterium]
MARLGSLDYVMFFAPDVQVLTAFYRDVLEATPIEEAYPHWARLRLANIDLGIHAGGASDGGRGGQPAFRVQDLATLRAHLEAHGVPCEAYAAIPGAVKMDFRDPAGNVLQALQWGADLDTLGAR